MADNDYHLILLIAIDVFVSLQTNYNIVCFDRFDDLPLSNFENLFISGSNNCIRLCSQIIQKLSTLL